MADKDLPSVDIVRKLLEYNPETGDLTWKHRDVSMFRPNGLFSASAVCKAWNTKYAGKQAFAIKTNGYAQGTIFGNHHKGHRVAWLIHYGRAPRGFLDHINGVRSDNRISNLREVDACANARNARLTRMPKSGAVGISWDENRKRWIAKISVAPKKQKRIGRFKTKEEAIAARKDAEKQYGYQENHGLVVHDTITQAPSCKVAFQRRAGWSGP